MGDDSAVAGDDAVVRPGRRAAAEDHRPGAGVQSPVRGLRARATIRRRRDAAMRQQRQGKTLVDFLTTDTGRLNARLARGRAAEAAISTWTALADLEKQFAPSRHDGLGPSGTVPVQAGRRRRSRSSSATSAASRTSTRSPTRTSICSRRRSRATSRASRRCSSATCRTRAIRSACPPTTTAASRTRTTGRRSGSNGAPERTPATPSTWALLATFNRYAYGKVARLMEKLTASGVLDNVLIYASSDMGNPALHSTRNAPTLLGGRRRTARSSAWAAGSKMPADCTPQPVVHTRATPSSRRARTTTCSSRSRRRSA